MDAAEKERTQAEKEDSERNHHVAGVTKAGQLLLEVGCDIRVLRVGRIVHHWKTGPNRNPTLVAPRTDDAGGCRETVQDKGLHVRTF